ncbi:prepilin-type N-terminal cleavage/methylation domain-containing protein [Agaribacterium sp. ZY112]|uniref:prepilin-type N-terminal cleavage/methylation domain-containing protein n=1 Tax=Agaribacterium sp. ZY112 TaxID=3233574 RepID=UPI0035261B86
MTYKLANTKGFSLFELVVVLIVIALLFTFSAKRYLKHIEESQETAVHYQASAFLRGVESIKAAAAINKSRKVQLRDGPAFYLNKRGWPVSSSELETKPRYSLSADSCRSLWLGLFSQVKQGEGHEQFVPSLERGRYCRYRLNRTREGNYYFDYDAQTGRIAIHAQ